MKNIIIAILFFVVLLFGSILFGVLKIDSHGFYLKINGSNFHVNFERENQRDREIVLNDNKNKVEVEQESRQGQGRDTENSDFSEENARENEDINTELPHNNGEATSDEKIKLNTEFITETKTNFVLPSGVHTENNQTENNQNEAKDELMSPSDIFNKAQFICKPPIVEAYTLRGYSYDYSWFGTQDINVSVETVYAPQVYQNFSRCKKDPLAWTNNKFARILRVTNHEKNKKVRVGFSYLGERKMSMDLFFDVYDDEGQKTKPIIYPKKSIYLIPKAGLCYGGTSGGPHQIEIFLGDDYIKSKKIKFAFPTNNQVTRILHVDSQLPCIKNDRAGIWRYKYELEGPTKGEDIYNSKMKMLAKYCVQNP